MMRSALVLVVIAAAVASVGCGDAPSCDAAIRAAAKNVTDGAGQPDEPAIGGLVSMCKRDGWKPALRTCISKAKRAADLTGCMTGLEPPVRTDNGGRRSEAELNLEAIAKAAAIHYIGHGRFPLATGELTPTEPCCRPGGTTRCPSDPAAWQTIPAWAQLNFKLTDSHYFQYSYESDGTTFVARAVGDLDCDTTTSAYEARGTSDAGNFKTVLIRPSRVD